MSPLAVLTRSRSESNQSLPPVDVPAIEVRDLGPLHVTWYEDGSVWARGLPPLHRALCLDDHPEAMRLRDFAQAGARIDRCTSQGALSTVRAELSHTYHGDVLLPYLMQWVEQRVRVIASALR
jgi:hypothetical protein